VSPENVSFADASRLRGSVIGLNISVHANRHGDNCQRQLKARLPSGKAVRSAIGGARIAADRLSLFDASADKRCLGALCGGQHG